MTFVRHSDPRFLADKFKDVHYGVITIPYSFHNGGWVLPGNKFTPFRHRAEQVAKELNELCKRSCGVA